MNAYKVTYAGLWLGGKAIVLADSEDQAIALVLADKSTIDPRRIMAELLTDDTASARVIYNDNGDY